MEHPMVHGILLLRAIELEVKDAMFISSENYVIFLSESFWESFHIERFKIY